MNRVVALLALSILINYMDRGSLAIAAPLLKDELGLSASQLGILLSSFFYTYSFFLPLAGWRLAPRNITRRFKQRQLCRPAHIHAN